MAATTWDPNNKAAGITLSGSNLVATAASGTNPGVFATRALSGPSYWQVTATTIASTMSIGIANRSWNNANSLLVGNDANSLGWLNNGTVRQNNATLATIATYVQGDVVEVAVNPQARLFWGRVNGGNWNNDVIANQNPVGNVGGIDFSGMAFGTLLPAFAASTTTGAGTAVFTSGFAHTAPTGYLSVDTSAAVSIAAEITGSGATHDGPARQDPVSIANQRTPWLGGYGSLSGSLNIAGNMKEAGVAVSGRRVLLFDRASGEKVGEVLTDGSGNFTMPALGRAKTIVVALDGTTYNAQVFDNVVPL
jgi:hypothetical protein